jgi:Mor family transcriptional regulator
MSIIAGSAAVGSSEERSLNAEWIKEISIEDLPESYQAIAQIVGLDNAIRLAEHLGGLAYYFPKIDALIAKKRDDAIRKEFNGANHKALARKYCLSEIWIRQIVQNDKDDKQPALL